MPDLIGIVPDAVWDIAIDLFLLGSGLGFIGFGALAFRRAAEAPRGWDRAFHALHALAQVGFGLVVLWALWTLGS